MSDAPAAPERAAGDPRRRHPVASGAGVVVVILVVVLTLAYASRRGGAPAQDSAASRAGTSSGVGKTSPRSACGHRRHRRRPPPAALAGTVPVGYPRTREGAQSAAANYATAYGSSDMFRPAVRRAIVESMADPGSKAGLLARADTAFQAQTTVFGLDADGNPQGVVVRLPGAASRHQIGRLHPRFGNRRGVGSRAGRPGGGGFHEAGERGLDDHDAAAVVGGRRLEARRLHPEGGADPGRPVCETASGAEDIAKAVREFEELRYARWSPAVAAGRAAPSGSVPSSPRCRRRCCSPPPAHSPTPPRRPPPRPPGPPSPRRRPRRFAAPVGRREHSPPHKAAEAVPRRRTATCSPGRPRRTAQNGDGGPSIPGAPGQTAGFVTDPLGSIAKGCADAATWIINNLAAAVNGTTQVDFTNAGFLLAVRGGVRRVHVPHAAAVDGGRHQARGARRPHHHRDLRSRRLSVARRAGLRVHPADAVLGGVADRCRHHRDRVRHAAGHRPVPGRLRQGAGSECGARRRTGHADLRVHAVDARRRRAVDRTAAACRDVVRRGNAGHSGLFRLGRQGNVAPRAPLGGDHGCRAACETRRRHRAGPGHRHFGRAAAGLVLVGPERSGDHVSVDLRECADLPLRPEPRATIWRSCTAAAARWGRRRCGGVAGRRTGGVHEAGHPRARGPGRRRRLRGIARARRAERGVVRHRGPRLRGGGTGAGAAAPPPANPSSTPHARTGNEA
ncbi:hypothetical protein ACU686_21380 [Yinghuangia aomiensis]